VKPSRPNLSELARHLEVSIAIALIYRKDD
jgi:hypothetical protein